jgi:hypothetical protein
MRQPVNVALFDYWNALRGDQPLPARTAVDPGHISSLLDKVFLIGLEPDGHITYRLAGSTLAMLFGGDLRNRDLLAPWSPVEGQRIAALVRDTARDHEVGLIEFEGLNGVGDPVPFEMIVLPLARHDGADRWIGAIVPEQTIDWRAFGSIQSCRLVRRSFLVPQRARKITKPVPLRPHHLPRTVPTIVPTKRQPSRPSLRVLDGGRSWQPPENERT